MVLTTARVLAATGGRIARGPRDTSYRSCHTDSRDVGPGGLFFALRGAAADGHEFCADAARRGAAGLVVDREVGAGTGVEGPTVIRVEDTWRALYDLAGDVLRQVSPLVIGITGSNGKTSTRELTAAVLGARYRA